MSERVFTTSEVSVAIDIEPELPNAMPAEMWNAIRLGCQKNDKALFEELLRIVVRKTKQGIRDRLHL